MSVVVEKSLGTIKYQLVDDYPSHTAVKGTIAYCNLSNIYSNIFINIDGTTDWKPLLEPIYSEVYRTGDTAAYTTSQLTTVGGWYSFSSLYNQGIIRHMTTTTSGEITVNEPKVGLFFTQSLLNGKAGGNSLWVMEIRHESYTYNGGTIDPVSANFSNIVTQSLSHNALATTSESFRYIAGGSSTNGIILQDIKIGMHLISVPRITFHEDWSSGNFNNWNVVNGTQVNKWYVNENAARTGVTGIVNTYGALISNGASNSAATYTTTSSSIVQFYKDITFSSDVSDVYLSFYYQSSGETQFDYIEVYITDTGYTPVAGTDIYNVRPEAWINWYYGTNSWTGADLQFSTGILSTMSKSLAGKTKRLIFQWVNDSIDGSGIAPKISDIYVFSYHGKKAQLTYLLDEGFELNNLTGSGWSLANSATNKWCTGTATKNGGTYAAYISNNNGVSAVYTKNSLSASHLYRDFTIPAGAYDIRLEYDWRCMGRTTTHYGTVHIIPTTSAVTADTALPTNTRLRNNTWTTNGLHNNTNIDMSSQSTPGALFVTYGINLSIDSASSTIAVAGGSFRLVFSWINNTSTSSANDPAFCIDNVKIMYKI